MLAQSREGTWYVLAFLIDSVLVLVLGGLAPVLCYSSHGPVVGEILGGGKREEGCFWGRCCILLILQLLWVLLSPGTGGGISAIPFHDGRGPLGPFATSRRSRLRKFCRELVCHCCLLLHEGLSVVRS